MDLDKKFVAMESDELHAVFQREKLVSVGELAYGIAHEILNPLTGIKLYVEMLRDDDSLTDKQRKRVIKIFKSTEHIEEVISNLQFFASPEENMKYQMVDIIDLIRKSVQLSSLPLNRSQIKVKYDMPDSLLFNCSSQAIIGVFFSIIQNSITALNSKFADDQYGKELTITLSSDDGIKIEFADNGCGISEENIGKIFDPFFTTSRPKSKGLGLSTAYNIVLKHKGLLNVESIMGQGTKMSINFPKCRLLKHNNTKAFMLKGDSDE